MIFDWGYEETLSLAKAEQHGNFKIINEEFEDSLNFNNGENIIT